MRHTVLWVRVSQQKGAVNAGPEASGGATGRPVHLGQSERGRELGNDVRGTGASGKWVPLEDP